MVNFNSSSSKGLKIFALTMFLISIVNISNAQDLCRSDTSFTDIVFLIDNSQSIDNLEFEEFSDIILATIGKVKSRCADSQLGVVHYGGARGAETSIEHPLSRNNQIEKIERSFCTSRNSSGFCSQGGGDDLNNAIGDIILAFENGDLNRNPNNSLQLVIFTDAFGFEEECTFINCSVIKPFTNIDILKSIYDANVTVVGASAQAEASLLAIYASPGGIFDNVALNDDCEGTFDGCVFPRKYIPVNFDSPVDITSDSIAAFVECNINVIQVVNPELGPNVNICGNMEESATLTVSLPDGESALNYTWSPELPNSGTVTVSPNVTTKYTVTVMDENGCVGTDEITVFVEDCEPDCSPDTSFTDIIFLVDNSQSIDDQEFESFEDVILSTMRKVEAKCQSSQIGLVHYGGDRGAETEVQYQLSSNNTFTEVKRRFCTMRNSSGFCSEGGGDDLNHAIGDIIAAIENGSLNRNPVNKLRLVIFTDAFGFEQECTFINCSVIRPFTNIDRFKSDYDAKVTVVGASTQAEASLLAIYASPGGQFDNVALNDDCESTFDGCQSPRKYIPIEFDSPVEEASDSIVACVDCDIEIIPGFVIDLGPSQTICSDLNESASINAEITNGVEPIEYTWSDGLPPGSSVTVQPSVTTTYTLMAIDAIGCMTTASVTISVEKCIPDCVDPPIFSSCPDAYDTCPEQSIDPSISGMPVVISGGENCSEPVVTYRDDTTSVMGCNYAITRTWSATYTDFTELVSTCTQLIQVTDTTGPVVSNLPEDIIIDSNQDCQATVSWTIPDADDNCELESLQSNIQSGSVFEIGTTEIIYTATDKCGNITMASFNVTVNKACCTAPPTLTCPQDYRGCLSTDIDESITGSPTVAPGSDECPDPTLNFTDDVQDGATVCSRVILRTWTATYPGITDDSLTSTCVQTITLEDMEEPVISNLPMNITIDSDDQCTANVTWEMPTANDNCGIDSLVSTHNSGDLFEIGTTEVIYTATDNCGNQSAATFTVTVVENCCTTPPMITCPDDFIGCPDDSLTTDITGIAIGAPGNADCPNPTVIFNDVVLSDTSDCYTLIERTFIASYPGNNDDNLISTCVQLITLIDVDAPIISGMPDDIVLASDENCVSTVSWDNPITLDNCSLGDLTVDIPSGSTFEIGSTIVTYTSIDDCGNIAQDSFTITITEACCTQNPIIVCPEDYVGCIAASIDTSVLGIANGVGGSVYCDDPVITYMDVVISEGPNGERVIERVWKATDPISDSLMSSCVQLITLEDSEPPVLEGCPEDVTLDPDNPIYTWEEPQYSDNCEAMVSVDITNGSTFETGTTIVTYTVTDNAGNEVSCSFEVTVPDKVQITCPDDMVIRCLDDLKLEDLPEPIVESNCIDCSEDNIEGFQFLGYRNGHSYHISDKVDDWQEANTTAQAVGGYLAIINDAEENEYLKSMLTENSAFIGLQDHESEGDFTWSDGSSLSYSNWFAGQPNNYGNRQDYVEIMRNGQWNDQSNDKSLKYIIEVECIVVNKSIDNIEEVGESTIYTITYTAMDRCGTENQCSFQVTTDNEAKFECPDDITVTVPYGWTRVSWEDPVYNTCCTVCPSRRIRGYIYMGNLGNSYYYCSAGRSSWRAAKRKASEIGGSLVVIEGKEENDYISSRIIRREAYIGLTDEKTEGKFQWVDGSNPSYTNWASSQPNGDGDYVHLNSSGNWNDDDGSEKREFVVEIKGCDHVDQIGGPVSGSTFRTGSTTITYRATDGCGGVDTCSFNIIINTGSTNEVSTSRTLEQEEIVAKGWEFDIYPNPVTTMLHVDITSNLNQLSEVQIFQSNGLLVNSFNPASLVGNRVDVSTYTSGLYLIKLIDTNGGFKVKKFTVN